MNAMGMGDGIGKFEQGSAASDLVGVGNKGPRLNSSCTFSRHSPGRYARSAVSQWRTFSPP